MKTILITGGAGEIGSGISNLFAENGYKVIITYNANKDKAEKLIQNLPGSGHSFFHAPNTNPERIEALVRHVQENYGHLNVLVNNAGITTQIPHHDLDSLTDEWIDKIMQTNFRGGFAMARAFKNLLIKGYEISQKSSCIVNISSIAGQFGIGSNVAYCASKAAVDSMTRSLGRALSPEIRTVSVCPGFVEGEYTKNFDQAFIENQREYTPLKRFSNKNDVAKAVWSVTELLEMTLGSIINVDGGRLLGK